MNKKIIFSVVLVCLLLAVVVGVAFAQAGPNVRWEYRIVSDRGSISEVQQSFNHLGLEGWELVTVDGSRAYFKRRLP